MIIELSVPQEVIVYFLNELVIDSESMQAAIIKNIEQYTQENTINAD